MTTVRTRNQALQHILDELEAGRLGAIMGTNCAYENDEGNHCAIGCLFTPAFHDEIRRLNLSHSSLGVLKQELPVLFTDATNGFAYRELKRMQSLHDDWAITKSLYAKFTTTGICEQMESASVKFVNYINSLKTQ